MTPVKSAKSKENEGTKGCEDQDTRAQGLEKSTITMTAVIQKRVYESNALFGRMLKEMTDHEDRTAPTLQCFERAAALESQKSEEDRKVTASVFLAELASKKKATLDACAAATKANLKTEDDAPSPERVESAPHGLNPDGKQNVFSPSHPLTNPHLPRQNGN